MRVVIAIPVLNEEQALAPTVETLRRFAADRLAGREVVIVIADNGSTDRTGEIGSELAERHPDVRYLRLSERGKGRAIRAAWNGYPADVSVFMDADLSTDLEALPALIDAAAANGGLAVGSRFLRGSKVERTPLRRLTSLGYMVFQRLALGTRVADLPCGFKAASAAAVGKILPRVRDNGWFFDSELVVRAERAGLPVAEVPVVWRENPVAGRRSKVPVGRLAVDYARRVWRLRRELGSEKKPAPAAPPAAPAIGRREWIWVGLMAALAAVVTALPPLYGVWEAGRRGEVWKGLQFLSPGDFSVYLSYIYQAASGRWLLQNYFTTERLVPSFNILWSSVGLLARVLRLAPVAAYHVARTLLIFPLAGVSYLFIARFFRKVRSRLAAAALFFFGSGVGLYLAPLFPAAAPLNGRYEFPIDMWVAEANTFLTMLYSPHFAASLLLLLLSFYLLLRAFETGRLRFAVFAGLAALALFDFHPFHAPTLYAVPAVWLAWRAVHGRATAGQAAAYAVFVLISLPSVAYQYYLTHYGPSAAALVAANVTVTPAIWHLLIGFGPVSLLWLLGWLRLRRQPAGPAAWDFLAVWIIVQTLLVYSPLTFQRRLIEGLEFPLVMLSVAGLAAIWPAAEKWLGSRVALTGAAAGLAVVLCLPTTFASVYRSFDVYSRNEPPIFYFSKEESAALDWIRTNTAADAVFLASLENSNSIVGWGERRVFAGHWANTIDLPLKNYQTAVFFGPASAGLRARFARQMGIDYVYCGPAERSLGGCPDEPGLNDVVYASDNISIIRVSPDTGVARR